MQLAIRNLSKTYANGVRALDNVEDVTDLCSEMAILHEGRVLFEGQPEAALAELEGRVWQRSITNTPGTCRA
jgi:ABC-type multidrug transport system ATPase subunit